MLNLFNSNSNMPLLIGCTDGVAFKSLSSADEDGEYGVSVAVDGRTEWNRRSARYFVSHHAHDGYFKRALRKLTTWPRSQLKQGRK